MTTPALLFNVLDYGAVGNDTTDDTTAIQNAINAAAAVTSYHGFPGGKVYAPAGHSFKITSALTFYTPVKSEFNSPINYTPTSGSAIIIGNNSSQQYHDHYFVGVINSSGNSGSPSSVNGSGTTGIEVRGLNFSKLRCDSIDGFTQYGFFGNGTNNMFTGQNIEHNRFDLGQVVNNGVGIYCASNSATSGAFEANYMHVNNCYQGVFGMYVDGGSFSATTSNYWLFDAIDNVTAGAGGQGIAMNGSFNRVDITFQGANVWFGGGSHDNTIRAYNTAGSGATVTMGGTNNTYITAP